MKRRSFYRALQLGRCEGPPFLEIGSFELEEGQKLGLLNYDVIWSSLHRKVYQSQMVLSL